MKRSIGVFVGDARRRVGTVRFDSQGARQSAAFEYDREWLVTADRFALEPGLPLVAGAQFHKPLTRDASIFHGAIADTEPDGWARRVILRDHAKRRATARAAGHAHDNEPLTPIDFLLAVGDANRVGALRFNDEGGVFQRAAGDGRRTAPPLIELSMLMASSRAVETHTETAEDLAYLRGRGTSLGGLRPKCSIIDDDGALSIGKFPSVDDERAVTKGEVLALQLAKSAGINVPLARLIDSDGVPVTLIRRFDRTAKGRLMYVSAATLLGVDAGGPAEHTYTEIVDTIRQHGADAQTDIAELWRRIAFSILINNVDDHLRNHGFLHAAMGQWRLSPAFDINPFPDRQRELKTWISEDAGPNASVEALMAVAPYFKLDQKSAIQILAEVERAVSTWRIRGRELGMSTRELEQFADAFEHREREVAQSISGENRK
ncbi:MAG: type II toxin-antitoxin system HipA family toxin [Pseudomonadota bacterium]|nr:type II toxin-antitoxin system HipA family toxin [Pseudomonadota bacterium]